MDGVVQIIMVDDRFDPASMVVPVDTTVDWVNNGRHWHSLTAFDGSFDSGRMEPGEHFRYQFTTVGTYQYICEHHGLQGMLGVITVE